MRKLTFILQLIVVMLALAAVLAPPGAATVEPAYANGIYPILQANVTSFSNRVPFALFDLAIVVLAGTVIALWYLTITRARKKQRLRAIGRALAGTVTVFAIVYLWFLTAWGFNYARAPLESRLPYDASRVTPQAVRALAERAVAEANRAHAAAHAAGFPSIYDAPRPLITALQDVERELGRPRTTVIARPKWSILSPFFRISGVSGMLGPFFLETIVNPDLTGPERPVLLAHEWAHLSGYAPESDASFVGVLASLRAGPAAEYSAWLELVSESVNQLQPVTQQIVLKELAPGPRKDQDAIRERLKALVRPVERVAWSTYDQMLKSQGVEEGVHSYSRVVQLILGTDVLNSGPGDPKTLRP